MSVKSGDCPGNGKEEHHSAAGTDKHIFSIKQEFGSAPDNTVDYHTKVKQNSNVSCMVEENEILSVTIINSRYPESSSQNNDSGKEETQTTYNFKNYVTACRLDKKQLLLVFAITTYLMLQTISLFIFSSSADNNNKTFSKNNETKASTNNQIQPILPSPWIVRRTQWDNVALKDRRTDFTTAIGVSIRDTETKPCYNISSCSELIRKIKANGSFNYCRPTCDIIYNFFDWPRCKNI